MNNDEKMKNFHPKVILQKYAIFSNFTSVAKWDSTLFLCIQYGHNWYLLEAYDLGDMLDTFISIWKCVENFLEPFKAKIFLESFFSIPETAYRLTPPH